MGRLNTQGQVQAEPEIYHFSHPHPLQLSNHQPQQSVIQASCSGCKLLVSSGWIYSCLPCNYYLHIKCSQMSQQITHPFHPTHLLDLLPKPIYQEGAFSCDACGKPGTGFSYHCSECSLDLHSDCASLPFSITHQFHVHQLELVFSSPYHNQAFSCDICKMAGANHWLYRCSSCEFDAHLACATSKPIAPVFLAPTQQSQVQQIQAVPRGSIPQFHNPGTQFAPRRPPPRPQNFRPNFVATNGNYPGGVRPNNARPSFGTGLLNQAVEGLISGATQAIRQTEMQDVLGGADGGDSGSANGGSEADGGGEVIVINDTGTDGSVADTQDYSY